MSTDPSQLTPKQSSKIAKLIAQITGLGDEIILDQVLSHIGEKDVLQGIQLNQQLNAMFEYDHLKQWALNDITTENIAVKNIAHESLIANESEIKPIQGAKP